MSVAEKELTQPVTIDRLDRAGKHLGTVQLDPAIFAVPINVPLLHQVVTAQLAARRSGTQSTKTRAEVRGGSHKPFRQKGTGSARQGSIRAPHYAGGGVALGPKPRSYDQRTPKKMIQQALRCALSDQVRTGGVRLVDQLDFEVPKTKDAVSTLGALGCDGKILVVVRSENENAIRSFSNLPDVLTVPLSQLTAYDVVAADVVVFTDATLPGEVTEAAPAKATGARKAAGTRKAAAPKAEAPAVVEAVVAEDAAAEEATEAPDAPADDDAASTEEASS
jgi:large subunit ribosomal protein L4